MGSFPFARHYSGNCLFSSGYLDVSVPQVPFPYPMCSDKGCRWFATAGFPIRISPDRRLYTASRGFSQCPTSFFGIWRLGIHHKLLLASFLIRRTRSYSFSLPLSLCALHCTASSAVPFHYSVVKVLAKPTLSISAWPYSTCPGLVHWFPSCGDDGTRTRDFRLAKAALSQLSYIPAQIMIAWY